jgi:hypothetical protein
VAVTVTGPEVFGAVNKPVLETVPAEADQFTALLKLPVPWTVAVQVSLAPSSGPGSGHATEIEVIVGGVTVTVAVPDFVASAAEVAVMVTDPAAFPAVNTPAAEIVPAEAVQFTAVLKFPVPCTVAVQASLAPSARLGLGQETVTEVIVGAGVGVGVGEGEDELPPQPAMAASSAISSTR